MLSLLRKHWTVPVLLLVLLVGGFMRLYKPDFDQGTHQHPDERAVTDQAMNWINIPPDTPLSMLLDPAHSPLNPRREAHRFPYGAMPLYIVKGTAAVLAQVLNRPQLLGYDDLALLGRSVSGVFDLVTIFLVFLIGRRLYGQRAGLLAAIFSALAVTHIQIAHFFIVDPYLVMFLTASLYFSVILMQTRRAWAAALAGLFLGFAFACKASVALIAVLIVAAVALRVAYRAHTRQLGPPPELSDPYGLEPAGRAERRSSDLVAGLRGCALVLLAGVMTLAGAIIGDPFGVLDSGLHASFSSDDVVASTSGPFFTLGNFTLTAESGKYLAQLGGEAAIQRGTAEVPYTIQYVNTLPVIYHFQQVIQWGMGPASGLVALAGLFLAFWLAWRRRPAEILLLSGMIPYFLTIVILEAKWMRYMLPLVPYLCILAGALLARGLHWSAGAFARVGQGSAPGPRGWSLGLTLRRYGFPALSAVAILGSLAWAVAFMNIYTHDHSRIIASHWLNYNLAPGAQLGHEHWDDNLPLGLPGDPNGGWGSVEFALYEFRSSPDAFNYIVGLLSQTDDIIESSNRLYDSIPREPWRFPVVIRYYELLFAGKLGFEQVIPADQQKVYPEIFGIKINDDHADESFTVYDHPKVSAFKKVRSLSEDELRVLFGSSINQPAINVRHLEIKTPRDYDKSLMLPEPPGQQLALGDYAWNPLAGNQWIALLLVLIAIEVLGLVAWPLTAVVCRRLPDRGYPLSKILALVVVGWLAWMGASLHVVPFTFWSILGAVVLLGLLSFGLWRRFAPELRAVWAAQRPLVLAWEGLFLVAFGFFLFVRLLNPDLWQPWLGGEKPMEFAFFNSVLRSPWMPPGDPFFGGGYINYYYYGYVLVGLLVKLVGVSPSVGFNLVLPTLYGLTALGAASLVYNCVAVVQRARGWRPPVSWTAYGWSLAGTVLLIGIGNLVFLFQFLSIQFPEVQRALVSFVKGSDLLRALLPVEAMSRVLNGYDFWGASRVIPGTINEFPYWSFLFADLHPHLIDICFSLLVLGMIFNLLLGAWRWPVFVALPGRVLDTPVPPVPAPGVFARAGRGNLGATLLETTLRLWGSHPGERVLRFATFALALGTLFAVNSWDFPIYVVVTAMGLGTVVLSAWPAGAARRRDVRLAMPVAGLVGLGLAAGVGLAFYAPFLLTFKPFYNQIRTEPPPNIPPDTLHTELGQFLVLWGLFVFIAFSYLLLRLLRYPWGEALDDWGAWLLRRPRSLAPAGVGSRQYAAGSTLGAEQFGPRPSALAPAPAVAVATGNGHAEAAAHALSTLHSAPHKENPPAFSTVYSPVTFGLESGAQTAVATQPARVGVLTGDGPPAGNGHDRVDYPAPADYTEPPAYQPVLPLLGEALAPDTAVTDAPANGTPDLLPTNGPGTPPAGPDYAPAILAESSSPAYQPTLPLIVDEVQGTRHEEAGDSIQNLKFKTQNAAQPARVPRLGLIPAGLPPMLMLATVGVTVWQILGGHLLPAMLLLLIGGLIATHLSGVRTPGVLFGGLLIVGALGVALGVEYIYLADHLQGGDSYRMNTVFKFYEQVWVLIACGSAVALYALIGPRGQAALAESGSQKPVAPTPDESLTVWTPFADQPPPLDGVPVALADPAESPSIAAAAGPAESPAAMPATDPVTEPPGALPAVDPVIEPPTPHPAPVDAAHPRRRMVVSEAGLVPAPEHVEAAPRRIWPVRMARTPQIAAVPAGPQPWFSWARAVWMVPFVILGLGCLIFMITGTQARVADRMPGTRPDFGTLDGMDWMDKAAMNLSFDNGATSGLIVFQQERKALDWMNHTIKGTPVIAAAPREYYREGGMIVGTYTGLPMVVGGLHQDEQRYDWLVGERRGDMNDFFRSDNVSSTLLLINKYDIEYIYIGQIERISYGQDSGLAKFPEMVGPYLEVAYQSDPADLVTIYHVKKDAAKKNVGVAPGSVVAVFTPRPKPTEPPLGDDPNLKTMIAAAQAAPDNLEVRRALADYYREHEAWEKATVEYEAVVRLAPKDVAAHHLLGDMYIQNGAPDKALAVWEDAAKQAGPADQPAAYNKIGLAYLERQRFDDAINAFKTAVAAKQDFVEGWFHLGEAYQISQHRDEARAAFENCIKFAPNDESGQQWKEDAQQRLDSLR